MVRSTVRPVLLLTSVLASAACGGSQQAEPTPASGTPRTIEVVLAPRSGSKLSGKATFTEVRGGVKVTVQVAGAPPGEVATHVHEIGDCSAPDAKSAGEHFNPAMQAHGLPRDPEHHLGDLGNIDIAPDGTGKTELVVKGATLQEGDPSSYVGRAIIVHEKKDDGGQPSGNAGERIGCGVIGVAR